MENVSSKKQMLVTIISFLLLEVLVLISFNLTSNIIVFSSMMLVILLLMVGCTFRQLKVDGMTSFLLFLVPVVAYGLLSVVSNFAKSDVCVLNSTPAKVFTLLGLLSFASVGFLSTYLGNFKIKNILIGIYASLAVYVLINLFLTMIQFSAFYTIFYRDYYFYYDGNISNFSIAEMAYCLVGFTSKEVTLGFFSLFPSLLSTALVALFFIKYKENKKLFLAYAVCGGIGLLALILTPSKLSLITDFALIVTCLFIVLSKKVKFDSKKVKLVVTIIASVLGLLFIIFVLNAQKELDFIVPLQNAIKSNPLLNQIFNTNKLSKAYSAIISHLTNPNLLYGFEPGYYIVTIEEEALFTSGSWLFDNYMVSGLIGQIFFVVAVVLGLKNVFIYFKKSNDEEYEKVLIVSYVLVFLVYTLFNYDSVPYIFADTLMPMYVLSPFLIMLFFIGYTYSKTRELEVVNDETK